MSTNCGIPLCVRVTGPQEHLYLISCSAVQCGAVRRER